MQAKETKLKPIITQNNIAEDYQLLFMNPISKRTFQALPKIYGARKKKKFPIKHPFQQRIQTIRHQIKQNIKQNKTQNIVNPNTSAGQAQEDQGQIKTKRFKTQMRSYDKQYAKRLSKPKQQFCQRRYCFCRKEHNIMRYKNQSKSTQSRKIKSLNIKLPQINNISQPDDIQTKHKVMSLHTQKNGQKNFNKSKINLLDLLRNSHHNNRLNNNDVIHHDSRRSQAQQNIQKQQVPNQPVFPLVKKNNVQVQTEYIQLNNKKDIIAPQKNKVLLNKNKGSKNDMYIHEVSPIESLNSQEQNFQKQQKDDIFSKEREDLQKMKKKYQMLHDKIDTDDDNQSLNSSISAASLSKYVFSNNDKQNTVFQTLNKKQNSSSLGQNDSKHQTQSVSNKAKSVLQRKNAILFSIPEEEEFVDYLQGYKPMNQKFKIKNLVRKDNFKAIKNQDGVFFGQIINQSKNGQGLMISQKLIFQGDFQDNQKVYGCQKNIDGVFRGQYVKGVREGYGKFQWNNGQIFQGEWKGGKKNGFGIWKSPKGDYYEGQWRSNRQHGKGIFKHKLSTYKGEFSEFLKNGQGQQIFINGDKFIGSYKQGKPHGFGKYFWANGSYYEGNFTNGIRQGKGLWRQLNGTIYEGEFKNDFKNGYGKQIYTSGQFYEGYFINGQKSQIPNILTNNQNELNQNI